ncbi:MAG TPA: 50S ribosomal protein L29 [Candidatus Paceibacterota bacterium]
MKYRDIQSKSKNELEEMLKDLRIKLGKLRFELAGQSLKDTSQIGKMKRDIARVLTASRTLNI